MTEAFLQYVWQHQLLGRNLSTVDGQAIKVLKAGELNKDAGPDFFNAHIRIGDVEWVGNVEVHIHTSDWKAHRHTQDKGYNNVILHVVYDHDCEVLMENGKAPATLQLKDFLPTALYSRYESLCQASGEGIPCGENLATIPDFLYHSYLDRLVVERIEAKSGVVRRLLDESQGGWEQTCYWLMAHYFGGKVNAIVFEMLAKSIDQRLLSRWKDNPQRIEALLMGQAGFLEGYFEDEYPRILQADYEALRAATGLTPISGYLWRFYCLRPSSFPTIRISQFAHLVAQSSNLFSTLLDMTDARQMLALFNQQASDYWNSHYHFDKNAKREVPKRLGRMQATLLIINAWVPLLFVYGEMHGQQHYKEQALNLLQQLAPEDNNIIRRWDKFGIVPMNAAESQALIQLYNVYCSASRCLDCPIGFNILKHS